VSLWELIFRSRKHEYDYEPRSVHEEGTGHVQEEESDDPKIVEAYRKTDEQERRARQLEADVMIHLYGRRRNERNPDR
jgi:hypothetical protein